MRIRILDPHWEKIDPDPGNEFISLRFTDFSKQKMNLNFFLFFPP